jgi:hypothetical protein
MSFEDIQTILGVLLAGLSLYLMCSSYKKRSVNIGTFFIRHEITEKENPRGFWFFIIVEGTVVILVTGLLVFRLFDDFAR